MKLTSTRETKETTVTIDLADDGTEPQVSIAWEHHGQLDEEVDQGMAEHLYHTLLRYARLGGTFEVEGDLAHHVIEDGAILLGELMGQYAQEHNVIRFADPTVAMDDALVQVVLDAGGRAFYESELEEVSHLWDHVLRSLALKAEFTLHILPIRGHDPHHLIEAAVKGTGMALHTALAESDRLESTKGRPETGDEPR